MNYQPLNQTEITSPSMNLASMICGIIGLLMCAIPFFGMIAPAFGMLLALMGRGNQMKTKGQGRAGLIMGIIGLIANFIFTMVIFYALIDYLMAYGGVLY